MIIGILNSGGDCPGINAVIEGFVMAAYKRGWRVVGFHDGFEGLLPTAGVGRYEVLNPTKVHKIRSLGGTLLGTTNKGSFKTTRNKLGRYSMDPEIMAKAKKTITALGLEALIVIGGGGSALTAKLFAEEGLPVITIPKTINNDVCPSSDYIIGFKSAVEVVSESIDKIRTTARAHQRMMVVEVMGDLTGWIALHSGISSSADVVLIPEIDFDLDKVVACIKQRKASGQREIIVIVSEGAKLDGEYVTVPSTEHGKVRLGGIGNALSRRLEEMTGIETRYCVLGHTQRGGAPCAFDRILGLRFGVEAVKLIETEQFGKSLILNGLTIETIDLDESIVDYRLVDPKSHIVRTARDLGIIFGDRMPGELHLIEPLPPCPDDSNCCCGEGE